MTLDRLTNRARTAILSLPQRKKISGVRVLDAIKKSQGMGEYLLINVANIHFPKNKDIDTAKLIKEAYYQSIKFEHPYVGTEHLLLGLLKLSGSRDLQRVKLELVKLNVFPNAVKSLEKGRRTPILDAFSENLNQRSLKSLDNQLIMRTEYDIMVSALLQSNVSSVLLVGDPGVGKDTLVELLARNITALEVPPILAGYQVVEFDIVSFLTSLFSKGGLDMGLAALSDELKGLGRVIFSVKNFQNIFFATSAGLTMPMFYSMFKSMLDITGAKLIATMNTSLYEKIVGENDHMIEDFTVVQVNEPGEKETLKILEAQAVRLSSFHGIKISPDVIKHIYKKARAGSSETKFPQRGIDLMDRACSYVTLKKSKIPASYKKLVDKSFELLSGLDENVEKGQYESALHMRSDLRLLENKLASKEEKLFFGDTLVLTVDDVNDAVTLMEDDKKVENDKVSLSKLAGLADSVKRRIIGQDEAVDMSVKSLIRSKLGLRTKKRTLGNFLFLGPTGVGKTELAKVLADEFFGEKSLIRLDMSDFSEKHNVARLVGAPPGYVGYGEGGELTTKIEARPDSIVLFDEIEKAHPDVLNILLQIMEEAELTDARGNVFDFSKAVIVLTSNLGTEILHNNDIGFGSGRMSDKGAEARLRVNIKKILKPELLNRFDEIVIFNRLKREDQFRVLEVLIKDVIASLHMQRIKLEIVQEVRNFLVKEGYSDEYGARALRRTVEKKLLDKIAEFLLEHRGRPLSLKAVLVEDKIKIEGKVIKNAKA